MSHGKVTSKRVASIASRILRDPKSTKSEQALLANDIAEGDKF